MIKFLIRNMNSSRIKSKNFYLAIDTGLARISENHPDIQAAALIAFAQPGEKEIALKHLFTYHHSKFLNKSELYKVINKCYNKIYPEMIFLTVFIIVL